MTNVMAQNAVESNIYPMKCAYCGQCNVLSIKCGYCTIALYCNQEHQLLHWERHKLECALLAETNQNIQFVVQVGDNMQGNMQPNLQQNMGANLQTNMAASLQANMHSSNQANLQTNMQANLQANLTHQKFLMNANLNQQQIRNISQSSSNQSQNPQQIIQSSQNQSHNPLRVIQSSQNQSQNTQRIIQSSQNQSHNPQRDIQSSQNQSQNPQRIIQSSQNQSHNPQRVIQSSQNQSQNPQRINQSAQKQSHNPQRVIQSSQNQSQNPQRIIQSIQNQSHNPLRVIQSSQNQSQMPQHIQSNQSQNPPRIIIQSNQSQNLTHSIQSNQDQSMNMQLSQNLSQNPSRHQQLSQNQFHTQPQNPPPRPQNPPQQLQNPPQQLQNPPQQLQNPPQQLQNHVDLTQPQTVPIKTNLNQNLQERSFPIYDMPKGIPKGEIIRRHADYAVKSLNNDGYCVIDALLGESKLDALLMEVHRLSESGTMKAGQVVLEENKTGHIRGDKICWVNGDEDHCKNIKCLMNVLDHLINYCDGRFAQVIKGRTQAMVACYHGDGVGYKYHIDNGHKDGRCLSCLYYMNKDWDSEVDGGALKIYPFASTSSVQIDPIGDRLLIFWSDSRTPHEVLPPYKRRFAITIWYFDAKEREEVRKAYFANLQKDFAAAGR